MEKGGDWGVKVGLEKGFEASDTTRGKLLGEQVSSSMVDCHCARSFWGARATIKVGLLAGTANTRGAIEGDAIVFVKATGGRSKINRWACWEKAC